MEKRDRTFIIVLALVSMLGFLNIVGESLFDRNISIYVESIMIMLIGVGLMLELQMNRLMSVVKKNGLTKYNFATLTTFVIAIIALLTGLLNMPFIGVSFSGFLAIKGILSILAIIVIFIQTWVMKG